MPEYKIILDAGHGGSDPGAVHQGRNEKDDTLRLTLAVGNLLEQQGVDVVYTRTTDVYQTPFEKATIANRSGADFFVSIHRNSSPVPNQYNGVEVLVYDKSGIKYQMAQNIVGALGEVGFKELGVKERPGLVVLRRTRMPAVLVEAGFINSDIDNELFDTKFDEIARAIADAILGTLNEETVEGPTYYRVQVGAFAQRPNADRLLYQLQDEGYPAFLLADDGLYRVQVGAYLQLDNAVRMEQRLRDAGYSTFLTTR
ncbi:MAG: N-acetylmuramoyl-L-alanine amidase [Blautia sp.]